MHNRDESTERIVRDPAVLVGKPVVRGTRIPVSLILNYLDNGHSIEELIGDYPILTAEDVDAAVTYAEQRSDLLEVGAD